jgi:hypothetical protein
VTAPISQGPCRTPPDNAKHDLHSDNGSPVTMRVAEWWGISRRPHMVKGRTQAVDSLLDSRGLEHMVRTWGSGDLRFEDILSRGALAYVAFPRITSEPDRGLGES